MWLAPIKRQLSPAVLTACQKRQATAAVQHPLAAAVDRSALPEATRPYNVLLLRLAPPGGTPVACSGLLLHNYNKSSQDAARGVKRMIVLAGGLGCWGEGLHGSRCGPLGG